MMTVSVLVFVSCYWFFNHQSELSKLTTILHNIQINTLKAIKSQKYFFTNEINNESFYQSGKSRYLDENNEDLENIKNNIIELEAVNEFQAFKLNQVCSDMLDEITTYESLKKEIVSSIRKRGFGRYGIVGEMNEIVDSLENIEFKNLRTEVLSLRKYEKNYLISRDTTYKWLVVSLTQGLMERVSHEHVRNLKYRLHIISLINEYQKKFVELAEYDQKIGFYHNIGLYAKLINHSENIELLKTDLVDKTTQYSDENREQFVNIFIVFIAISLIISFVTIYLITSNVITPVVFLSQQMDEVVKNKFTKKVNPLQRKADDEIGQLTTNFNLMIGEINSQLEKITNTSEKLQTQNEKLQKQNEKQKKSEDKLKKLNSVRERFISIISHDLKGPLNTISSFMQLLIQHSSRFSEDELKSFAGKVDQSVKNIIQLLDNLLQWSRAQTGDMVMKVQRLELKSVVDQSINLLSQVAKDKSIELSSEVDENIVAKADKNTVDFIIRNLISNAIKFTPEGGKIQVKGRLMNRFAEISIIDNGVGMTDKQKENMFIPGVKNSTPGTKNEKGTGLGLILVKDFVERNEGELVVESIENVGTTINFTLPIY